MSSAVSALQGASHKGAVEIAETGLRGMITLRGDFADADFAKAIKSVLGAALPGQREVTSGKAGLLIWMSPDEMLAVVDYAAAPALSAEVSAKLAGKHHLAQVVSDARAVFSLKGQGAREVLAKGAPVDLAPAAFAPGHVRRTRLGQVAVAFWMTAEDEMEIVCFRSVAAFVFEWLKTAAAKDTLPEYF